MYFLLCSSAGSVLLGKALAARSKGEKNSTCKIEIKESAIIYYQNGIDRQ